MIPRTDPAKVPRPSPYPIAHGVYPLTLPVATITLASPFACKSCMGYRFDTPTARKSDGPLVPCAVCHGEGMVLPGETMAVDLAGGQTEQYTHRYVSVCARLRSPWINPNEDWYAMSRAVESEPAWGVHALRRAMIRAVLVACRGYSESGMGVLASAVNIPETPWPKEWAREPPPRADCYASEELLSRLDYSKVTR